MTHIAPNRAEGGYSVGMIGGSVALAPIHQVYSISSACV